MVDLFAFYDLMFFELFKDKVLFGSDIFNQFDTSEGTFS